MSDLPNPMFPLSPVSLPRGHFIARMVRREQRVRRQVAAVWKWFGRDTWTRSGRRNA